VDTTNEIREFVASRRAKITPEHAGLRTDGGTRHVPALRQEAAALLAGVSVEYYTRLEPGSAEALNLLGSWAATLDQMKPANVTDR
jgi:hypothetical protein